MAVNTPARPEPVVTMTGCCARFDPSRWDAQELHLDNRRFVYAKSRSLFFVPLNMGKVFTRVTERIAQAGAQDPDLSLVMSRDRSPFSAEHLFAVTKDVPGEPMMSLSGHFLTRVFEGPYESVRHWCKELLELARARGFEPMSVWFYYTTCPTCAKAYGKNYVVGLVEVP